MCNTIQWSLIMAPLIRQLSTTQEEGSLSTLVGKVHNHCHHSGTVTLVESSNIQIQIQTQIQIDKQIQIEVQIQTQIQGPLSTLGGRVHNHHRHPSIVTIVESWTTQDVSLSTSMGYMEYIEPFWNIEGRCRPKYECQAQNWKQTWSETLFRIFWFSIKLNVLLIYEQIAIQFCAKCLNISRWQEGQKWDGVVIKFEHGRSWPTSVNNWA